MMFVSGAFGIAFLLVIGWFVQRGERRHQEARMRLIEKKLEARQRAAGQAAGNDTRCKD